MGQDGPWGPVTRTAPVENEVGEVAQPLTSSSFYDAIAGISQHLPRAAALASLRDACLVCALGTAPAEVWTAPLQSTAMLALTISCIHPNKVGGDEGMRSLLKGVLPLILTKHPHLSSRRE